MPEQPEQSTLRDVQDAPSAGASRKRETIPADPCAVLAILEKSNGRRPWSSIAAELHGIDRSEARMPHVRGVRDACARLVAVHVKDSRVWVE